MIAWAHVLAWPIAVVAVSSNLRRAIACLALMLDPKRKASGTDTSILMHAKGTRGDVRRIPSLDEEQN